MRTSPLSLVVVGGVLASLACGGKGGADDSGDSYTFQVDDLAIQVTDEDLVYVTGTVGLAHATRAGGTTANVRLYSDDYKTEIDHVTDLIGSSLAAAGDTQAMGLYGHAASRMAPSGDYERVCVEFRADDSNVQDWYHLGCVE